MTPSGWLVHACAIAAPIASSAPKACAAPAARLQHCAAQTGDSLIPFVSWCALRLPHAGVSVPFVMFASWEAAILGSLPGMAAPSQPALGSEAASEARAARTSSVDGRSPALTAAPPVLAEAVSAASSTAALPAGRAGGRASSTTSGEARSDAAAVQRAEAADPLALLAQSSGSVGPLIQVGRWWAACSRLILLRGHGL